MTRAARGERGQATVELLAVAPLVLAVVLVAVQLLALGRARELAGHAAEAGAVALAQGHDAPAAVRAALPGWPPGRLQVHVRGRRVAVVLRPVAALPAPDGWRRASATADAGPTS